MKKVVFGVLATGFISLSSFTTVNDIKSEREIKVKTVLVDDIWCCTATDGVQSVTACGSYPCTRAKEALKKLQQTA